MVKFFRDLEMYEDLGKLVVTLTLSTEFGEIFKTDLLPVKESDVLNYESHNYLVEENIKCKNRDGDNEKMYLVSLDKNIDENICCATLKHLSNQGLTLRDVEGEYKQNYPLFSEIYNLVTTIVTPKFKYKFLQ